MQVSSSNIIRFPLAHPAAFQRAGSTSPQRADPAETPNIVAFPPAAADAGVTATIQEHGRLFAAHRIVARVADQLELTPTL